MNPIPRRLCRLGLLLAGSTPFLAAQTATPPANSAGNAGGGVVVQLSPFTVSADSEHGYVASEEMTGSRVATKIQDLPYNINIITSEFMNDFGMFEIGENLGYDSSLNNFDQGGGYNLRGFAASNMLRNGFFRLGLVDKINVDRIVILRGTMAGVYGQTTPGGLLNVITKRPKPTPERTVTVYAGSYATNREEVSLTGPLAWNTDYLFSYAHYDRNFDTPFSALRNRTVSLALERKLGPTSDLLLEAEYLRRTNESPEQAAPYTYLSSSAQHYQGIATALKDFNPNGPNSHLNREIEDLNLTYENTLNGVFSLRAAASWYHRHYWLFNNTGINYLYLDGSHAGTENRGTPTWGLIGEDGGGLQADLLASYGLFDDRVKAKTLVTLDYSTYWRFDPQMQISSTSYYQKYQNPAAPDYRMPDYSPTVFNSVNRWDKNRTNVFGTLVSQRAALGNDRLLAYAGVRFDEVVFNLWERDKNTTPGYTPGAALKSAVSHYSVTASSPMIGVNYKLRPTVAAYANWSQSFTPQSQTAKATTHLPNETARGWDYGFKCAFLDETLHFTLGGYYVQRNGISVSVYNPDTGLDETKAGGSQLARGVEFDGNWRVSDEFTLLGGFGHVHSIETNAGVDRDALGRPPAKVPENQLYLAGKLGLTGRLKGLSLNLGVRYLSRMHTANPTDGGITDPVTHLILSNDGRREITVPSYSLGQLGIRYRFRTGRWTNTVGLNIDNLFNRVYLTAGRIPGDRRSYYASYALEF